MDIQQCISESFLHYIWKNRLFKTILNSGKDVEIINPGSHNTDAGPDFFNAKIKIDGTVWAGNVEIHKKSSDWDTHKHHTDKAYDNVILHIVNHHDKDVFNSKGEKICTAELEYNEQLIFAYEKLRTSNQDIRCSEIIQHIDKFTIHSWLSRLLTERLERKTDSIQSVLEFTKNNWEESFYISLARSFGFKVNALPFEMTAKSLPSIILAKNKSDSKKIEALLFGQAGFLEEELNDDYYNELKNEYAFQKKKYSLKPIETHLWKFLRIRPVNFPTMRLAQFAQLVIKSSHLFSKILEVKEYKNLYELLSVETSPYWETHYTFGKESKKKEKKLGKNSIDTIIINTIIPFLFIYGKSKNKEDISNRAVLFLEAIKPEQNKIVKNWESVGIQAKNAYFSQALIQLFNEYCIKKKCFSCRIGNQYLKSYV